MNEEHFKSIAKFSVAIGNFVESWEEQTRKVAELRQIVALICLGYERQFTKEEWTLMREYAKAWEQAKTSARPTSESQQGDNQQSTE